MKKSIVTIKIGKIDSLLDIWTMLFFFLNKAAKESAFYFHMFSRYLSFLAAILMLMDIFQDSDF